VHGGTGSQQIRNSIIWGNTAGNPSEAGIYNDHGSPVITYSIVQGSSGSGNGWVLSGATNGGGNAADPGTGSAYSPFVDLGWQDPASVTMPNSDGDYRLKSGSPAYNAGSDALYPDTWAKWQSLTGTSAITEAAYNMYVLPALAKDLGGANRIQGDAIDLGAYEMQ
jgi:hypothetical protein